MAESPMVDIEIAYAPNADTQMLITVQVAEGSTAEQAIIQVGWAQRFPDILSHEVGVFSRKITWQTVLSAGDRLEIYRPLLINPMQKRQKRSAKQSKWRINNR